MGISQAEEKKAVAAGYWNNFRFDPRKADNGENPFTLDSKAPTASYRDFIMGRGSLQLLDPAPSRREQKSSSKRRRRPLPTVTSIWSDCRKFTARNKLAR